MISHSHRFIFIHTPRTGGTLVESGLARYGVVLQGKGDADTLYFKHATARRVRQLMGSEFQTYFRFGLARNPWDWVVSNYTYCRGLHRCYVAGTPHEALRTERGGRIPDWAKKQTFEEWLPWWLDAFHPSQHQLLTDERGALLVNEVYHFESLDRDIVDLCGRLDLEFRTPTSDTRSPNRRPYRDYYTPETWALVAERLRTDIDLFGYAE